ncbi:MAG TPA: isoprenylcysteine carboxylmethyltransferase family protein [Myxococcota bacterium]|nr:isoprenylcysteine carboxylmethyltransferase family protein [Myxococcota bacterium]
MAAYLFFLIIFMWTIAFVGDIPVAKTLNTGLVEPPWRAALIDVALLALFAVQHSLMARDRFKRLWTRVVPVSLERSTYVVAASMALGLLVWQWRPLPATIWRVENDLGAALLEGGFWLGWSLVLVSTFLINHFNLVGLEQAWSTYRGHAVAPAAFKTPSLYRVVRHPLYLGFVVGVWMTPLMTQGHLLFASGCTAYILLGIFFEERDLVRHFGDAYRAYQAQVPKLLPLWHRRSP